MASRRGAFAPLKLLGATRLEVGPDRSATLRDRFTLLGVVPVQIEWTGRLTCDSRQGALEIVWDDTSLRWGWGKLGGTKRRPPAAERLRQQPWIIDGFLGKRRGAGGVDEGPLQPPAVTPVIALRRLGVGTLAFRKA
ncbi:unnamed protein product [Polarella glacialis]|uniref:Uncharacterized protein n=1 Tax=Polarella glacialis TaxID=89957 RepID=A0A813E9P0_POLGL|nr:unnamed protein product [Polarella glacialis]